MTDTLNAPALPIVNFDPLTIARHVCCSVAELGDRNSPEGQPDMMLVTADELLAIVIEAFADQAAAMDAEGGRESVEDALERINAAIKAHPYAGCYEFVAQNHAVEAQRAEKYARTLMLAAAPDASPSAGELTQAERDVLAERRRQVQVEGWTPAHDDEHGNGEMAVAASCYALHADAGARQGGKDGA